MTLKNIPVRCIVTAQIDAHDRAEGEREMMADEIEKAVAERMKAADQIVGALLLEEERNPGDGLVSKFLTRVLGGPPNPIHDQGAALVLSDFVSQARERAYELILAEEEARTNDVPDVDGGLD